MSAVGFSAALLCHGATVLGPCYCLLRFFFSHPAVTLIKTSKQYMWLLTERRFSDALMYSLKVHLLGGSHYFELLWTLTLLTELFHQITAASEASSITSVRKSFLQCVCACTVSYTVETSHCSFSSCLHLIIFLSSETCLKAPVNVSVRPRPLIQTPVSLLVPTCNSSHLFFSCVIHHHVASSVLRPICHIRFSFIQFSFVSDLPPCCSELCLSWFSQLSSALTDDPFGHVFLTVIT